MEYDIQATDFCILPLTLQPICENAVKHGIRGKEEGGTVRISTYRREKEIVVCVEDDGIGFEPEQDLNDNQIHVGLDNVRRRLGIQGTGRLEIISQRGKGTKVYIILEEEE